MLKHISIYQQITLVILVLLVIGGEANITEQEPIGTIDTFIGSTVIARGGYDYKPQVLAVNTGYYDLVAQYDWNADLMYRIMIAESLENPNAVNTKDRHRTCNGSYGLMQLSCEHLTTYGIWDSWNDPETNIRVAYEVYKRQGITAWGAYTDKRYKSVK